MTEQTALLTLTADIVSAFVSNNTAHASDLPEVIRTIHSALVGIAAGKAEAERPEVPVPAVPVKRSVAEDHITCLEDGKTFKSLKRHLQAEHGMTPDQYRERWGLPRHYPMVAPHYAAARSELARAAGLGNRRRTDAPAGDEPVPPAPDHAAPAASPVPKRRGRPRKQAA